MTTNSTMTDLERRATDAVIKLRQEWGTQEPRDSDTQLVRAVIKEVKAHLERHDFVVVRGSRPRKVWAAAQQEDQPHD